MSTMSKLVNESINEMEFGKIGRLKSHLSKKSSFLESQMEGVEDGELPGKLRDVLEAQMILLNEIEDIMNWDLTSTR